MEATSIDMGSPRIRVRTPAISVNSDDVVRPSISFSLKEFHRNQLLSAMGDVGDIRFRTAPVSDISACSNLDPSAFSSSLRQRVSVSMFLQQFHLIAQVQRHLASMISDFIDGLMTRMPLEILMISQIQVRVDIIVDLYDELALLDTLLPAGCSRIRRSVICMKP